LLEAVRSDSGEKPEMWQYALCPMSSRRQTVRFADDEVESIESFYRQPVQGRREGRYVEKRLGPTAP
jgi:hypothetical protein